jgi:hypothetical protein
MHFFRHHPHGSARTQPKPTPQPKPMVNTFPAGNHTFPANPSAGRGRGFRFDGGARQSDGGWAGAGRGKPHAGPSGQSFRAFVRYCAICLGEQPHDRVRCAATSIASGKHRTVATRDDSGRFIVKSNGTSVAVCLDYNLGRACTSAGRFHGAHSCSGCGDGGHGAQECPRATGA